MAIKKKMFLRGLVKKHLKKMNTSKKYTSTAGVVLNHLLSKQNQLIAKCATKLWLRSEEKHK